MTAAQHYLNPGVRNLSVSVACLVSCQLFPYGRHRFEICRTFRNQQALCLDDRLIYLIILSSSILIVSSAIPKSLTRTNDSDHLGALTVKFAIQQRNTREIYTPIILPGTTLTPGA